MADEGSPPGPPGFPPVDDSPGPPSWPPDYAPPPWQPPAQPTYGYGGGPPPGYDWYGNPSPYGGGPRHWLHPLDVGRTFSAAWRLFRTYWQPMIGAMLVVLVPVTLIGAILGLAVGPDVLEWFTAYTTASRARDFTNLPLPPASLWFLFAFGLIAALFSIVSTGAIVKAIDVAYRGGKPEAIPILRAALGKLPTLLGAGILLVLGFLAVAIVGIVAFLVLAFIGFAIGREALGVFFGLIGMVAMIVAVSFFAIRWSLFVQAVMCENYGAMGALGRSWRLVAGSGWRVLGYAFLAGLVVAVVSFVFTIVLFVVDGLLLGAAGGRQSTAALTNPVYALVSSFLGIAPTVITTPWYLAVLTLLYHDLRWRKGETQATQTAQVPA